LSHTADNLHESQSAVPPDASPRMLAAKPTLFDRLDRWASKLSARSPFWQRVASFIWMPYSFKSGIQMKRLGVNSFFAVLPFKRINKNWYNAMAGAALLGNAEIAGGMYVFDLAGGDYTVVCKNLEFKFLRPCFGDAIYKINPRENLAELIASGNEFNITLDMEIVQAPILPIKTKLSDKPGNKERRVGKCVATFHVTPKAHQVAKGRQVR
jgi:hypothetical protein